MKKLLKIARSDSSFRRKLIVKFGTHQKNVALMKWLSKATSILGVSKHTYVVGGAVRNFVIDKPIKDIDIVIDSQRARKDSDWLAESLKKLIPTEVNVTTNQYGVAILTIKGDWVLEGFSMKNEVIEIANARKESYGGEGGKGYKPSTVEPATIEEDLRRREFNFNTLLWRLSDLTHGPEKAEILDLTGCGLKDLKSGILSCPSDPDQTFSDDPTRMLRAIKFTGKYGFKIPPDLRDSIRRNASKLKRMPWEAVGTILVENILQEPSARKSLVQMKDLGLLDVVSEMVREIKPFQAYLNGKLRTERRIPLLFDLLELDLPIQTDLSRLGLNQKEKIRLKRLLESLSHDHQIEVLEKIVSPPVDNMRVFQQLNLKGPERSKVKVVAREILLENPFMSPKNLTEEVIQRME